MRILFLSPCGQLGGAEISLLDTLAGLRNTEPNWALSVLTGEDGPFVHRVRDLGVEVRVLEFPEMLSSLGDSGAGGPAGHCVSSRRLMTQLLAASPAIFLYCLRLRRAIRQLSPDVIHTNGFKMHLLGLWARSSNIPVLWRLHEYVGTRPLMKRAMKWQAKRCSAAVANSASTAHDAIATFGGRLRVRTVLNAVDLARFSPNGAVTDLDLACRIPPAEPETIRLGLVATLARWKGHEVFLRAVSLLPPDLKVRGYIIGDALYRTQGSQYQLDELRSLASRLGIADKIGFSGFLNNPAAAMRGLDIAIHASTQPEPFGLAIAEAMACGRPVIASSAGGAREIIDLGDGAVGHTPGDSADLASCIERLARDPSHRARMGLAARQTAERFFDRTRLVSELVSIYREVIAEDRYQSSSSAPAGYYARNGGANV